jgi:tRNA pseudouridine38-40 synthase
MVRIALGIEYDGSGFAGWQSQSHGNTVQDALEKALTAIADHPLRVVCAGRTDAGVHALGQVVHFDTTADRPDSAWVRGVNAHLPPQVAVGWARPVAAEFHARFSARSRTYRYLLLNRPVRPALLAGRCGWFHRPLDVAAMRGGRCLVGEHDFTAFRAAECQAKCRSSSSTGPTSRPSEFVLFDSITPFLHMICLIGSLVYIGKGKHPPQWLAELLAGRDRSRAAPTFDAAGLYFAGVEYDPCWQLPGGSPGFGHTILPSSLIRP